MKQLTIAIPAYNSENFIRKCLDSMVGIDPRLEIIVIDDGSTDRTAEIANEYSSLYPDVVFVISKANGGHGSGINTAIKHATGRYFKVIDSDDWIVTENLIPLLDELEQTDADAIITGYNTINMVSGKVLSYSSECKYVGEVIDIEQLLEVYDGISSCCSFHGLMYRTEMYRNAEIVLSEGIFYEDQEYATLPFVRAETVLILPFFFYQYLIGNSNQSVAFHNQVKRIGHIEAVIKSILEYRKIHSPLRAGCEEYFMRKLAVVVVSYFAVALVKNPNKRQGREQAATFEKWLSQAEPELLRRTEKKRKTMNVFNRLHIPPELYQAILDTDFYKKFRKIWMN